MSDNATYMGLSPATQAKLLRLQVAMKGLFRDFWKDADYSEWPSWLQKALPFKKPVVRTQPVTKSSEQTSDAGEATGTASKEKAASGPKEWIADRVQVMEAIWGEGHVLPGGEDYIRDISAPLGINKDMSLLDLGAGLGGLARFLAIKYETYVTGMEIDNMLATRGMVMSIAAGKSKQASVITYDPANFTATRKYDCIFAREVFYRVIGKEKFFKAVDASLKTGGGQLIFTDYILDPKGRENPAVTRWLAMERNAAPLSMIETIKLWKGMGYDLRVAEDQTQEYRDMIIVGLKDLMEFLKTNIPSPETKKIVLLEIDRWSRRLEALKNGLRYCRFYALKY